MVNYEQLVIAFMLSANIFFIFYFTTKKLHDNTYIIYFIIVILLSKETIKTLGKMLWTHQKKKKNYLLTCQVLIKVNNFYMSSPLTLFL